VCIGILSLQFPPVDSPRSTHHLLYGIHDHVLVRCGAGRLLLVVPVVGYFDEEFDGEEYYDVHLPTAQAVDVCVTVGHLHLLHLLFLLRKYRQQCVCVCVCVYVCDILISICVFVCSLNYIAPMCATKETTTSQ
jgi:hypothetical protein